MKSGINFVALMIAASLPLYAELSHQNLIQHQDQTEQNQNSDLTQSVLVAQEWLALLDKGNYEQSWDKGAKLFQQTITRDEWKKVMDAVRKPLGNLSNRNVLDQRTASNPKGLPEGDYMVLFYNSSFQNKSSAYELITMMKESDGQWRVLTYQVQ